jgi:hypothetical protein
MPRKFFGKPQLKFYFSRPTPMQKKKIRFAPQYRRTIHEIQDAPVGRRHAEFSILVFALRTRGSSSRSLRLKALARQPANKTRSRPAIGTAFARGCLTALSFTASHGEVCACGPCFQWKPSPPVRAALARLTDRRSYDRPSADQRPQLTAQAGGSVPQWRRTFRGGRNAQVLRAPKRTLKPSGCSPSRTAGPASHAAISGRALKTSHACIAEYSACIRPAPQQKFRAPLCRSCGG